MRLIILLNRVYVRILPNESKCINFDLPGGRSAHRQQLLRRHSVAWSEVVLYLIVFHASQSFLFIILSLSLILSPLIILFFCLSNVNFVLEPIILAGSPEQRYGCLVDWDSPRILLVCDFRFKCFHLHPILLIFMKPYASHTEQGILGDVWRYETTEGKWYFVSGEKRINSLDYYESMFRPLSHESHHLLIFAFVYTRRYSTWRKA